MEPEPSAIQPKLAVIQEARFAQSAPGEEPELSTGAGGTGLTPKHCQDLTCTAEMSEYFTSSHSEQICEKLRRRRDGLFGHMGCCYLGLLQNRGSHH